MSPVMERDARRLVGGTWGPAAKRPEPPSILGSRTFWRDLLAFWVAARREIHT